MALVPIGVPFNVNYINKECFDDYQDLHFLSETLQTFSVNRCVFACASGMCYNMLQGLYECPIANSDDNIYISTNFTDEELKVLVDFLTLGLLPSTNNSVDREYDSVFETFGLNLDVLSFSDEAVKFEPEDIYVKLEKVDDVMDMSEAFNDMQEHYSDLDEPDLNFSEPNSPAQPAAVPLLHKMEEDMEEEEDPSWNPDKEATKTGYIKLPSKAKKYIPRPKKQPELKLELFKFPQTGERDFSKIYQCGFCIESFPDAQSYRQHFLRHQLDPSEYTKKVYPCLRCLNYWSNVVKHVEEHGKVECPVPSFDDETANIFYYCVYCQPMGRFDTFKAFSVHVENDHPDKWVSVFHPNLCIQCGKGWRDEGRLKLHMKKEGPHHDMNCATCAKPMGSWKEHQDHVAQEHGGVWKFKCGLCSTLFDSRKLERNHRKFCIYSKTQVPLQVSEDTTKSTCTFCGVLVDAQQVRHHMSECHADKGMKCKHCPLIFFDNRALRSHELRMHGKKLPCDQCGKEFASKYWLKVHIEGRHTENAKKPYQCPDCDLGFPTKSRLNLHSRVHNSVRPDLANQKKRVCEVCAIVVLASGYMGHLRRMHGSEEIKCEHCGRTYRDKIPYERHIRMAHTYVTCEECGSQFTKQQYPRHILQYHTPEMEKPFICKICNPPKGFIKEYLYKEHLNIHTGERPFVCKYCPATFKNCANKFKHIREAHKHLKKNQ